MDDLEERLQGFGMNIVAERMSTICRVVAFHHQSSSLMAVTSEWYIAESYHYTPRHTHPLQFSRAYHHTSLSNHEFVKSTADTLRLRTLVVFDIVMYIRSLLTLWSITKR